MPYLRNVHPTRAIALPVGAGRMRLLPPGETAAIPRATAALPSVGKLLAAQLVAAVDVA